MVPPSPPSKREGGKGLSRMHGNGHVRFLGGGAAAMSPCYPIAADAVVEERGPPPPADSNPHPRRHAPRPVHQLVSGHARQRWSARLIRCRSLSCPTVSGALMDEGAGIAHRRDQSHRVDRADTRNGREGRAASPQNIVFLPKSLRNLSKPNRSALHYVSIRDLLRVALNLYCRRTFADSEPRYAKVV
jgi:hypothetical protein